MNAQSIPRFSVASELPPSAVAVVRLVAEGPEPLTAGTEISAGLAGLSGFTGKVGEILVQGEEPPEILVGVGPRDAFATTAARRAAAVAVRAALSARSLCVDLRGTTSERVLPDGIAQGVVEGSAGAAYRYDRYRSKPKTDRLEDVVLVAGDDDLESVRAGMERGVAVAEAVAWARDLGNTAASDLTPRRFGEMATALANERGLDVRVLDEDGIAAERLGGLLGVARGSTEPPRLISLTYEPGANGDGAAQVGTVVLVGKGITYDSGGLSLKPAEGLMGMKGDMSGAAAVLAAVAACGALGVSSRVVAIAPVTENMPGGSALKPGDVLTTRNGKTIEVLNTDAEGRLVLSDALALGVEDEPDAIIDVATLTGACVVALGGRVAGMMGNDSELLGALEAAAERSGEAFWRLPLPREYRTDIDSDVADMKNIGLPRQAGALVAGLLLEEFVGETPWAHLDIAGPAFADSEQYEWRKGSTGFSVRTLLDFLQAFEPSGNGPRRADRIGVG